MSGVPEATGPVAENKGPQPNSGDDIDAIRKDVAAMERGFDDGFMVGAKLHEKVACAMFLDPKGVSAAIKASSSSQKIAGEFAKARKLIAAVEGAAAMNKDAKRKLTNLFGHASRNATYLLHDLEALSEKAREKYRNDPDSLRDYVANRKISDVRKAYEKAQAPDNSNTGKPAKDPRELLTQSLAGSAFVKNVVADTYIAPAGQIVPALIRPTSDNQFDIVGVFPDADAKPVMTLVESMRGLAPDRDRLHVEALCDVLQVRDRFFKPIQSNGPVNADKPDGDKITHYPQVVIANGGQDVFLAYPQCGPKPCLRMILNRPIPFEGTQAVLLFTRAVNDLVRSNALRHDIRPSLQLSSASPTSEDDWQFALEVSRTDIVHAQKGWPTKVSAWRLDPALMRDPLVADVDAFKPAATAVVSDAEFRKFYFEALRQYRDGGCKKTGADPQLKFTAKDLSFIVKEQPVVTVAASGDKSLKTAVVATVKGDDFITAADCIMEIARRGDVKIATDGKSLIALAVENEIGAYFAYAPIVPHGDKEPTAAGYRPASAVYMLRKAA